MEEWNKLPFLFFFFAYKLNLYYYYEIINLKKGSGYMKLRKKLKLDDMYEKITVRLIKELELTNNVYWSHGSKVSIQLKTKVVESKPASYYFNSKYYKIEITSSNLTATSNRHPAMSANPMSFLKIEVIFTNIPITLNAIPQLVRDVKLYMSMFDYIN
jgi:hypothetical protein